MGNSFSDVMKRNKQIAVTYIPNGDEMQGEVLDIPRGVYSSAVGDEASGEILDVPSKSAAQMAAEAAAAARALYTGGKYSAPNTLIPGMSYTEWLTKGGMNGMAQKQYDATVRAAETDYAKTRALYGQNAETLGRAGLTGSGYGDYLTGAGFSAMQGAKVAAADTKALTEAQQRLSYADYLAGVDAQNAQLAAQAEAQQKLDYETYLAKEAEVKGVIDQMVQSGMDDASIMAYVNQHYGDEFAGYVGDWIGSAHLYLDPVLAQNAAANADAQTVKYKEQIYSMLAGGASADSVRANMQYVMGLAKADTSQLDAWIAEAQAAVQPTVDALNAEKTKAETEAANTRQQEANAAYANSAGTLAPAVIEREMKNAGYTDDEILAARTNYHNNIYDTGEMAIKIAGTLGDLAQYSSANLDAQVQMGVISGIQAAQLKKQASAKRVELLDKTYKTLTNADAPDFIDQIHDFYESGDLSREKYAEYIGGLVAENVASIADDESIKEPVVEIAAIIDTIKNNGDVYGDIEGEVLNAIADTIGMEVNPSQRYFSITFTVGDKKESVGLIYKHTSKEERQKISDTLGAGTYGEIREYNGKLYQSTGNNTWLEIKGVNSADAGGKDIAPIIYELLLAKYK